MPYIQVEISKSISPELKDTIKSYAGSLIPIIPGKSEKVLMISIRDDSKMYFQGTDVNCAFVNINLYLDAPLESKRIFAQEFIEKLSYSLDIEPKNIFMVFTEYSNWVANGNLK